VPHRSCKVCFIGILFCSYFWGQIKQVLHAGCPSCLPTNIVQAPGGNEEITTFKLIHRVTATISSYHIYANCFSAMMWSKLKNVCYPDITFLVGLRKYPYYQSYWFDFIWI